MFTAADLIRCLINSENINTEIEFACIKEDGDTEYYDLDWYDSWNNKIYIIKKES